MTRTLGADFRTSIIGLIFFTLLCGLAYPLAMTGVAQGVFGHQANGSIVSQNGTDVGSSLIGQNFSDPKYFHGRPSDAGKDGYDATASSGSNLGPTSQALVDAVKQNLDTVRSDNGLAADAPVPVDAVTASASGLDPHISPAYAELQVPRVAKTRRMTESAVRSQVKKYTSGSTLFVMGEPRVNVLELNLALDAGR
jgi:K+-transporting ATPase ATPase C chain